MTPPPPLARSAVDRAAACRTDPAWLARAWDRARVLVVDQANRTLVEPGPVLHLLPASEAPAGDRVFLGVDPGDGTPYFAVPVTELPAREGATPATVREVGAAFPDRDAGMFATALALAHWHATHAYAPATGAETEVTCGGWVRTDPATGAELFPRTDPAVIMLIEDGVAGPAGRCLLGRPAGRPDLASDRRFYSTLAGFVEPGESLEAAVAREVAEEVGLDVSRLRYVGSQPWPFPTSLMVGFIGYADPAQPLRLDPAEIAEARWFTRPEVVALLSDRPDPAGAPHGAAGAARSDIVLPGPVSIAHYLIRTWLDG